MTDQELTDIKRKVEKDLVLFPWDAATLIAELDRARIRIRALEIENMGLRRGIPKRTNPGNPWDRRDITYKRICMDPVANVTPYDYSEHIETMLGRRKPPRR